MTVCLLGVSASVWAITQQQALFQKAVKSLDQNRHYQFYILRKRLNHYALAGYLDYLNLQSQLEKNTLNEKDMRAFLARWGHTPWGNRLKWQRIEQLATNKQWDRFFSYVKKQPHSVTFQCYYYLGQWATGHKTAALTAAQAIWISAYSKPDSCDALFSRLEQSGKLTSKNIWQRTQLAVQSGQLGLAKQLSKKLTDSPYAKKAQQLMHIYQHPEQLAHTQTFLGNTADGRFMISLGLHRLLRTDQRDMAIALWHDYRHYFSAIQQRKLELAMVRSILINFDNTQLTWATRIVKRYPKQVAHLFILRLRMAIFNKNWRRIKQLTDHKPATFKNQLLVRYWNIRANEQLHLLSKKALKKAYQSIAKERRFYAFLAAEHANIPYPMNHHAILTNPEALTYLQKQPVLARIREFIALGRTSEARGEWEYWVRGLPKRYQKVSAVLALDEHWYALGIRSAIISGTHDDLDVRFPLAFSDLIIETAQKQNVKRNLIYAIMRQESAFFPEAASSAGAQGLMQLKPTTAKHIAHKHHIRYRQSSDLWHPKTNITLGTAYIHDMITQFANNRAQAIAAYNAGPSRVSLWNTTRDTLDADAWIETIPFYETREYVKNVSILAMIYHHKLHPHTKRLAYIPFLPTQNTKQHLIK